MTLPGVSPDDRELVDGWVQDFEAGWRDGLLREAVRRLPPAGSPLRLAALTELVKIDLQRQSALGRRPRVEGYLHAYPELGTPQTVAAALVFAEYEARRRQGALTDPAEFDRRFPRQSGQLRDLMLVRPSIRENVPTTPPRGPETVSEAPRPSPAGLPQQFERYRILKKLGQGGMGTVYLARDLQLEREVALKVPRFAADDPAVLDRFYQEVKAAARLNHPNICPVYEAGCAGGVHYMTMAYVEGRPLAELVRADRFGDQRQAALLIARLARVLHYAHQKGVVHRDLKPSNVMINLRDEPVVMDFGLARRVGADGTRLTADGAAMGTPAYMAPEQVRGQLAAMGPACDVYSLGVMLYELLAGRVPFQGNQAEVMGQVLHQEPAPPSAYRPGLDPRLESLCLAAMAKEPARRPPSAEALADALAAWVQTAPQADARAAIVSAPPPAADTSPLAVGPVSSDPPVVAEPTAALPPTRPARRRLVLGGAAALVALVFAAAAGVFWHSRSSTRVEVPADPPPSPSVSLSFKRYPDVGKPVRVVREVTTTTRKQVFPFAPDDEPEAKPGDKPKEKAGDKAGEKPADVPDETVTTIEKVETYTETILEMADGQPCKYRRVYGRCDSIVNDDAKEPSYSRRTLLFERLGAENGPAAGEKVRITVEGGSRPEDKRERPPQEWQELLEEDDLHALEAEADLAGELLDVLSLPKDAVAVGGGWEIRISQAVGRAGLADEPKPDEGGASFDFFPVPGKRAVTLQKLVPKEGRQFGVLEIAFSGGPKSFTVGGPNAGLAGLAGLGGALGGGALGVGGGAFGGGALGGFAGLQGGMGGGTAPPLGSLKTIDEKVTLEFPIDEPTTRLTVTATEKTTASMGGAVIFRGETVRRYERSAEPSPE